MNPLTEPVYIVLYHTFYGGDDICGLYSTLMGAQRRLEQLEKEQTSAQPGEYQIHEEWLDAD